MNSAAQTTGAWPGESCVRGRKIFGRAADGFLLTAALVVLLKVGGVFHGLEGTTWPEAALVLAATFATLTSLSRELPLQNVLLASAIIAFIGGIISGINARTGIPFGPCVYAIAAGPKLFGVVPWAIPLIWVVMVLNARGVGRLILRPWRKTRTYGFKLMGLTALLALALDFGLEPFAANIGGHWLWKPVRLPWNWYGAPLTNFLTWPAVVLLMLAFSTPSLIRKKPGSTPPQYRPLFVWLLLNALFAGAAMFHALWMAGAVSLILGTVAAVFAVRGARW